MHTPHITHEQFAVAGPFDAVALTDSIINVLNIKAGTLVLPGGVSVIVTEEITRDGGDPALYVSDGETGFDGFPEYASIADSTAIGTGISRNSLSLVGANVEGKLYLQDDVLQVKLADELVTGQFYVVMRSMDLSEVVPV